MSEIKKLRPITATELAAKGVVALADRPNQRMPYGSSGISAKDLKKWFDQLSVLLAGKINELQNVLASPEAADYIMLEEAYNGVRTLGDLIRSMESGVFANYIMQAELPGFIDGKAVLQNILNRIAVEIGKNNNIKETLTDGRVKCPIRNGSGGNLNNQNTIATHIIDVTGLKRVFAWTDRPAPDGYAYYYGFRFVSDTSGEYSTNVVAESWAEFNRTNQVIDVLAPGLNITVGLYDLSAEEDRSVPLRVTDFEGYGVYITPCEDGNMPRGTIRAHRLYEGSCGNPANVKCVTTEIVSRGNAKHMMVWTDRPHTEGFTEYRYCWNTYRLVDDHQTSWYPQDYVFQQFKVNANDDTGEPYVKDQIMTFTSEEEVGVAFTIYEYDSNGNQNYLRIPDFEGYNIYVIPLYETGFIEDFMKQFNKNSNETDGSTSDIVSLNRDIRHIVGGIGIKDGEDIPKEKNYFTFILASDFHGDSVRFSRMVDYLNANNNIHCVICPGDFSEHNYYSTGFETTFVALHQNAKKPILPIVGNHDMGFKTEVQNNSNENVTSRFIKPYMDYIGGIQGSGAYYYRDFTDRKARVIVLNEYELPRVLASATQYKYDLWNRYISQTQADWLASTLNSVPSGYCVIVAFHQLIDGLKDRVEKFDARWGQDITAGNFATAQENIIQDIIDAYISKRTLSKTYSNTLGAPTSEIPNVVANYNFTNAGGEFACYVNGHTHHDHIGYSANATNKQLNVNVTTASANRYTQAVYDDLFREVGTKSEDCFNVVAIDTDKKMVRVLRVGANATVNMTMRDMVSVSYAG